MARKTGHISILQFDEQRIDRLRVRPSVKGLDVVAYDSATGPWSLGDGSLEKALREFAQAHDLARDQVYTVLPRHVMTARILLLPSHDDSEIEGMVRLGVDEFVPFPENELVLHQCVLQRLPDGHARVLAVFAHRDIVEGHVTVLRAAGVEPGQILVSTACLATAAILARPGEDQRYALVNLASGGLEVVVMRGNRLEYGRGVATTADWASPAEPGGEAIDELAAEVRTTLSAYRRESEDGVGVDQVYVCSDWADSAAFASALADALACQCGPARFALTLCGRGAEHLNGLAMVSLGAALTAQGHAPVAISLVPLSLVTSRRREELRSNFLTVGGLVLALVIGLLALFGEGYYQRRSYIAELQARIREIEPVALNVEAKRKQLLRLQQHLDRRGSALELLSRISQLTPASGLNITRFAFNHGEGITLDGRAETLTLVYALAESLREAGQNGTPQFARAALGPYKEETEQNQPIIQYEINIPFETSEPADASGDEAQ